MNILWFHFHCWHNVGKVNRRVTRNHGLSSECVDLTVQRCCQCPAKREGYVGWEGEFTAPALWWGRPIG